MVGVATFFGFLALPVWQAILMMIVGLVGVVVGFYGGELPARNYFQALALGAGVGLVMALGAVLSGSRVLLGVPLTTGSFILLVIVIAATFFAGFEPEAIGTQAVEPGHDEGELEGKEGERELAPQV